MEGDRKRRRSGSKAAKKVSETAASTLLEACLKCTAGLSRHPHANYLGVIKMPAITMRELLESGVHFRTPNPPLEPENEALCFRRS